MARMSELELEQRTNIKFLVKLGKSGSEIRDMLVQVYGDNAMKKTARYKWIKRFSEGREHVTDEERSGRPVTSRTDENIAEIRRIVCQNRRLTLRSIAEQVNIDRETVRKILTENLGMRKVCAEMVPKELTDEQKQRRVEVCQDLLERQDDVLGRVITGHETWVYQYDPETKRQSAQWKSANSPQPKKFHQSKSRVKMMLLTFFDIRGIIHYEFVPTGQTVNQVYYLEVLKRLREQVRQKRPELFANNSWLLYHDNAPAHTALSVREFLASKQITVLEHPPYSPDLAPSDFFLYPKIKEILKGRHFDDIQDIKGNTTTALMAIPEREFQNCFEEWTRRWCRCIASQGEYFEGDRSDIQQGVHGKEDQEQGAWQHDAKETF
ncbi:COX assembly mitochondrial protein 2 homolog isoform X1 [Rhinolophus sinicus]|uniref:COX assembly mitochondrial protein 2 homolog isoform X1 n=1 Tax=Rhinolophus sinicus TaxID=89399 RepID=UPI003D79D41B